MHRKSFADDALRLSRPSVHTEPSQSPGTQRGVAVSPCLRRISGGARRPLHSPPLTRGPGGAAVSAAKREAPGDAVRGQSLNPKVQVGPTPGGPAAVDGDGPLWGN